VRRRLDEPADPLDADDRRSHAFGEVDDRRAVRLSVERELDDAIAENGFLLGDLLA
jgi:hypothetical protein